MTGVSCVRGFIIRTESRVTAEALTSESRERGRERGGGEGTVGPGQSGLAVAAGQTSRQAGEAHERRVRAPRRRRRRRRVSSCRGSEN